MVFYKNIRCAKLTVIDRQRREMKSRLWQLNPGMASKKDILVALASVSVAILSPGIAIKILCLCLACSLVKVKG